jgi:hypothetical protein
MKCTPHGCRIDNGRALSDLSYDADTETVTLVFQDGSIYSFSPIPHWEFFVWLLSEDPGCYYNQTVRGRAGLVETKHSGPTH